MDFRITETTVSVCETPVDTLNEQAVDADFVLPDFCPDVAAVLKCTMTPTVQNRQMSADRLLTDGTVHLRVLYLDEERRAVRCCEFSQPFSATFSLPALPNDAFLTVSAKTDYINCRAVGPRRLDLHGAFTLRLKAVAPAAQHGVSAIEGDGVYTRRLPLVGTVPAACTEKPFSINEVLEIEGKRPAEQLLRTALTPIVTDCKVLANKAIVKGNLMFELLYVTDAVAGSTERVSGDIPFSQILDMEGLSEEWVCDATVSLISADMQVGASQTGESGLLTVSAKLITALFGWRPVSAELVSDAYCAHCPLDTQSAVMESCCLTDLRRQEHTLRQTVELPLQNLQDITDVWCEVTGVGVTDTEHPAVEGRLLWCMLVRDDKGEVSYYERAEGFSLPCDTDWRGAVPQAAVYGSSAQRTASGKLELQTTLNMTLRRMASDAKTVLAAVTPCEDAAYPPDTAALKICYATAGESLWDIARRCRTSVEAVMEENHISGDILPADTMLLIPLC